MGGRQEPARRIAYGLAQFLGQPRASLVASSGGHAPPQASSYRVFRSARHEIDFPEISGDKDGGRLGAFRFPSPNKRVQSREVDLSERPASQIEGLILWHIAGRPLWDEKRFLDHAFRLDFNDNRSVAARGSLRLSENRHILEDDFKKKRA